MSPPRPDRRTPRLLAACAFALSVAAAVVLHRPAAPVDGAPAVMPAAVPVAASSPEQVTCRGVHAHGMVVVRHVMVAQCPNTVLGYYTYNADVWVPPADGMLTCNGSNSHGDPPAPFVITQLTRAAHCTSFKVYEPVTAYLVRLPREGTVVCSAQRRLPAGWRVLRWEYSYDCRNPSFSGFADNAMVITKA